jgi:hypothetical protein
MKTERLSSLSSIYEYFKRDMAFRRVKHKYFASIATKYSPAYNYIFISLHVSTNVGHPQVNTL